MRRRTALRDDFFVEGTPSRLAGSGPRHTREISYPPQSSKPDADAVEIDGAGTLLDFTRVLRGVPGLNNSFAVGLIRLDTGSVLTAPLVDWKNAELRKGTRVVLAIGEIKRDASGNVFVGPRFRPA